MVESDFELIDFGRADANKERVSSNLLLEGFFDSGYIDSIVKGDKYFVFGLKGSGKSAIGSRLYLLAKQKGDMAVQLRELNDFDYTGFGGLVPGTRSDEEKYHEAWKFLMAVSFLGMYENTDVSTVDSSVGYKAIINGLKKTGLLPDKNFNNVIDKIIHKKLEMHVAGTGFSTDDRKVTQSDIRRMISNTNKALLSVNPDKLHLIVIDGLDSVLTKRENQYRILSALIHVTNSLNTEFLNSDINARVVVLCRTDVLDKLSDPNKTKYVRDSGITLDWYQSDTDNIEENNLCKLVNLRASVSLKRDVDVFREFIPKTIGNNGKNTAQYLLDRTRHMPRDFIQLMNFIQQESKGEVTEKSIKRGINRYSEEYFLSEVKDNFVGFLSDDEVDGIIRIIHSIGGQTTTLHEMKNTATSKNVDIDILKILETFYNEGVIGNIEIQHNEEDESSAYYHYKFRNKTLPFNENQKIHIHAGLHKALNLSPRNGTR